MRTDAKVKTKASVKKDKISEVKEELIGIKDNIFNCADSMWKLYKRKLTGMAGITSGIYDYEKGTITGIGDDISLIKEKEKEFEEDPLGTSKRWVPYIRAMMFGEPMDFESLYVSNHINEISEIINNKRLSNIIISSMRKEIDIKLIHADTFTRNRFITYGALNVASLGSAFGELSEVSKIGKVTKALDEVSDAEKIEKDIEKSSEIAKLRADDVLKDGGKAEEINKIKAENGLNKGNEEIKINERGENERGRRS